MRKQDESILPAVLTGLCVLVLICGIWAYAMASEFPIPMYKWRNVDLIEGWRCLTSDEIINSNAAYPVGGVLLPGGRWVNTRFTALTIVGNVTAAIRGGIPKSTIAQGSTRRADYAITNAANSHIFNTATTLYNSTGAHSASDELNLAWDIIAENADTSNYISLWEACVCGYNCGF